MVEEGLNDHAQLEDIEAYEGDSFWDMFAFGWLSVLCNFGIAKNWKVVLLAAVGMLLNYAGWWGLGQLFSGSKDPNIQVFIQGEYARKPWETPPATPLGKWVPSAIHLANDGLGLAEPLSPMSEQWLSQDPFLGTFTRLSRPLIDLFRGNLSFEAVAFLLLCLSWSICVWAFFGGAICRIAMLAIARGERTSIRQALTFVWKKKRSYLGVPLFPLATVVLAVLGISAGAWLLRTGWGTAVLAFAFPLVLIAGAIVVGLILAEIAGWPLMWASLSAERNDAYDALSRTYSYITFKFQRYLLYCAIATLYGIGSWIVLSTVIGAIVHFSLWALTWAGGDTAVAQLTQSVAPEFRMFSSPMLPAPVDPAAGVGELSAPPQSAVWAMNFWLGAVKLVTLAFMYGYFWTSISGIYLLLRYDCDNNECDDVYVLELDSEKEPESSPVVESVPVKEEQEPATP